MDNAYWDETQESVKRLANGKNRDDDTRWHRGILSTSENKEYPVWIYERGTNQRNGFLILKKGEPSPQSKKPQSKLYHSVETDNCQVWSFSNATEKCFGYGEMERFFGNDCQLKYIEDSIPGRTVETIRTDSAPHALEKSEGKMKEKNAEKDASVKEIIPVNVSVLQWRNEWDSFFSNSKKVYQPKVAIPEICTINNNYIKYLLDRYFKVKVKEAAKRKMSKEMVLKAFCSISAEPSENIFYRDLQKDELSFVNTVARKLNITEAQSVSEINSTIEKWKSENPAVVHALFNKDGDWDEIDRLNKSCTNPVNAVQKFGLFELVIGNIENAKLVILNNNPGADIFAGNRQEYVNYLCEEIKADTFARRKDSACGMSQDHFYPFDDKFIKSVSDYFYSRLVTQPRHEQKLFQENQREKISKYIVTLERAGYHSQLFGNQATIADSFPEQIDSVKEILKFFSKKSPDERPVIFIGRGETKWENLMKTEKDFFRKYEKDCSTSRVFKAINQRNPSFTRNSVRKYSDNSAGWDSLIAALNELMKNY